MKTDGIEILGIVILEPAVSLLDILTGLLGFLLAYFLWKNKSTEKSIKLFKYYFLFTGLTSFCAGIIGHGLLFYISPDWKIVGWSLSAFGMFFLEFASIEYFKNELSPNIYKNMKIIIKVQLIVFFISLLFPFTRSFSDVQMNAAFSYIGIILPLYSYSIFGWKIHKSWFVLAAIVLACVIALVYNTKITLNQWFNYDVFTHVLVAMYVILIYYAVNRLHPTQTDSKSIHPQNFLQ
jgi:hypothetical protein